MGAPSVSRFYSQSSSCLPVSPISKTYAPAVLHELNDCNADEEEYKEGGPGRMIRHTVVQVAENKDFQLRCSASTSSQVDEDPNLVDWVGDDDPEQPQNWKWARKWTAIALGQIFASTDVLSCTC